jgi:hypothetical protein
VLVGPVAHRVKARAQIGNQRDRTPPKHFPKVFSSTSRQFGAAEKAFRLPT